MNQLRIDIGIRIRRARKAHSLTQEEMSEKLGISVKHYGGAERGVTGLSIENLIEVSNILNVSLDFPIEKRNNILKILELIHETDN